MNSTLSNPPPAFTPPLQVDDCDAILPWLHHLRCLFPISRALVIGAGNGSGPWVGFLKKTSTQAVTLVEADKACFQQLQRATADQPNWTLCHQLIAPHRGSTMFHRTTVPCENGLLDAESLQNLWPRISTRESIEYDAITLADVMGGLPDPADWLFIDCLPALPIVNGALGHLDNIKVLVVRVISKPVGEMQLDHAIGSTVEALGSLGFRFLSVEANRNPVTGHAIFVRLPVDSVHATCGIGNNTIDGNVPTVRTESEHKESHLTVEDASTLTARFQSTITALEEVLARTNDENIRLNRKVITLTSHMNLLLRFLKKNQKTDKSNHERSHESP